MKIKEKDVGEGAYAKCICGCKILEPI